MKANYKLKLEEQSQRNEGTWVAYVYNLPTLEWVKELNTIDRRYELRGLYNQEGSKKLVERAIYKYGQDVWRKGINEKSTLRFYKEKKEPMKEVFYDGSFEGKLLFRARSGSLEVNGRTYRWNGGREDCQNCCYGGKETIEHFMIECNRYEEERAGLIQVIQGLVGQELWHEIQDREDRGMGIVLGFKAGKEAIDSNMGRIVEATKAFLKAAWKKRVV